MNPTQFDQDEYSTVLNSEKTYQGLAKWLFEYHAVVFAWTDQEGTQLDILLAHNPPQLGRLQRGMNAFTDLFVAVSSFGMFGFELNGIQKDAGYVGEKLNLGGTNTTTKKPTNTMPTSVDLPVPPHKHQFVVPVSWEYEAVEYPGSDNGTIRPQLLYKAMHVTKLRCSGCAEEIERKEPTSGR